jgi:amino acid transporter
MGIILFLRLGWGVSQAGVLGTLLIIVVAEVMAILTVLSFSAIVTNGEMAGGGSYFMISRSLGPEFGGAMGMLFYVAYAMGVAFYIIGFATEVQTTWFPDLDKIAGKWCRIIVGSVGLLFVLSISAIGADAFAKFNVWFFAIQFSAIIVGMLSYTFITHETQLSTQVYADGCDFYCDATTIGQGTLGGVWVCGHRDNVLIPACVLCFCCFVVCVLLFVVLLFGFYRLCSIVCVLSFVFYRLCSVLRLVVCVPYPL